MDWENLLQEAWQYHRGKVIGVAVGLIFGLLTAALGFWKALFIVICISIGYLIGKRVDDNTDFRDLLGRIFKQR